jgi:tetraacyldisaccharide 4'-kinase
MPLPDFFLRSFRILLFPFAVLYGGILHVRNKLYDRKTLKSICFNIPIINVGNLSVGGTGKSPMVEYLLSTLKPYYKLGTISRGYKRRTKGYLLADTDSTSLELGDEPMQFYIKYPDVAVAVGEERIVAVPQLLYDRPETQVIILDDAFQHRSITAGYSILLTSWNDLYTRDYYLPTGNLRDNPYSAERADCIVVTKCPPELTSRQAEELILELNPAEHQPVFFTTIQYGLPYHILSGEPIKLSRETEVLLVCGIANPEPLTSYLEQQVSSFEAMFFNDHHIFTIDDLNAIRSKFNEPTTAQKIILTTDKDAVRLIKFKKELTGLPLFIQPITTTFLFGKEPDFRSLITTFIEDFHNKNSEQNGAEE